MLPRSVCFGSHDEPRPHRLAAKEELKQGEPLQRLRPPSGPLKEGYAVRAFQARTSPCLRQCRQTSSGEWFFLVQPQGCGAQRRPSLRTHCREAARGRFRLSSVGLRLLSQKQSRRSKPSYSQLIHMLFTTLRLAHAVRSTETSTRTANT